VVPNKGKGVSGEKGKEEGGKRKWHPQFGAVSRAASREKWTVRIFALKIY
jgi:hypothetical protein